MIPTCNLSLKREIFYASGKFESVDTGQFLFKSEDLLLSHRIIELGYAIYFNPKIKVYHHNRTDLGHFLRNQLALGFSSAIARRLIITKGSIFVRYIFLALLIPAIKISILFTRMASYSFSACMAFIFHLPVIYIGTCFYTIGFIRGVRFPLHRCTRELR
jgi:hypothetical protein